MNTDGKSAAALAAAVTGAVEDLAAEKVDVAVCPPFVYLAEVKKALDSSNIALGAQDMYFESGGAFTGEISSQMLKDVGCSYVIVGHSERRHVIGETDELINKKLAMAISSGLLPILCVGETLDQRQADETETVVTRQLQKGMAGLSAEKASAVTIAYEPVWAIGTGKTASLDQAQQVHAMIRKLMAEMYDKNLADEIRIQYGGSVKPDNAAELIGQEDIDGFLVGGASLKADDFAAIIKAAT